MAGRGKFQKDQPDRTNADPDPLPRTDLDSEPALGDPGQQEDPAGQRGLHERERRHGQRRYVNAPAGGGNGKADEPPARPKEPDGAAKRVPQLDRRRRHRASVLTEEPDVRDERAGEGEEYS